MEGDERCVEFKNIDAKAILIPDAVSDKDNSRAALENMDLEEYEFDIVWSSEKNLWVTTLMNGQYLINAKFKGFKELNEVIKIIPGATTNYKYILQPINY